MMPTMSQKDDRCFIVVYEQQIPAARRITKELDATREMGWNNAYYRHHVTVTMSKRFFKVGR